MAQSLTDIEFVESLARLSEIPLTYKDKGVALQKMVELAKETLSSHACTLNLVNLDQHSLTQVACAGFDASYEQRVLHKRFKLGAIAVGDPFDFEQVARGEVYEVDGLQLDGQGIADPEICRHYGISSALCCPMHSGGSLFGYFSHFSKRNGAFPPTEKRMVITFAHQVALTVELLESLIVRERLGRLNDIMQAMTATRDRDRLMKLMLDEGLDLMGCSRGWISRLNYRTGELEIIAHRGEPQHHYRLHPGEGLTGKALKEERPVRADDVQDPQWRDVYKEFWGDTRSELAVPILISNAEVRERTTVGTGSKPIGVFNVESPIPGAFSPADESLLWSLARHAAVLIDRLDVDHKLASLASVQQSMVGKRDWDDIIGIVLPAITETMGYDYVNISIVDPVSRVIQTEYTHGIPKGDKEDFERRAVHPLDGADIQAEICRTRNIEVPGIEDDRFDKAIYKRFGHDKLIRVYMPMITSDARVMGTVEAGHQRKYRRYIYEQDVQLLKGFVDYAVRALEQKEKGLLERIGHEFRSPVVGIRNNVNFLQRRLRQLDETLINRKFDDILADCEMLLSHIGELEHILGRPSPLPKVERTLVFRDVVIKTIRQIKPTAMEQGLDPSRIDYESADIRRLSPLYLDKIKLNQVIFNLVFNAIKYAEDDADQFRIQIAVGEIRDAFIIFVRDWGIGIRPEYADKVFDEGFRAEEAQRKYVTGTGLGLTIARKYMRDMGGDLRLTLTRSSKPTEFQVILPKRLAEAPNDSHR